MTNKTKTVPCNIKSVDMEEIFNLKGLVMPPRFEESPRPQNGHDYALAGW
jgi:hypothetical protein